MDGMFVVVGVVFLGSIASAAIFLLALIVSALTRKDVKKCAKGFLVSLLCFAVACVSGITLGALVPDGAEAQETTNSVLETVWDTTATATETTATTEATEPEEEPVGSRGNPFVVTAKEFTKEIKADVDAAKDKYNGKWIKITGRVTDYSRYNSSSLSGYYLHGKYGKEGLKVVCWQNKGADLQFTKVGRKCTCIGKVREVSMGNATEIGDCQIVFE